LEYKLGSQSIFVDNNNDLGTGITPFIPNYYQMGQTFFGILHQSKNTWDFELGAKIDYKSINSYYFEGNNGITFNKGFLGGSVYAGMEKEWKKDFKSKLNLGLTSRSPEVNELLSKGLHQGLSSIEEGNISLKNETSFKSTLSFEGFLIKKISFNALGYFQFVKDYIYLQPQKEFRVTIRGAFPVYNTVQNNVSIFGTDLSLNYEVNANLKTSLMYNITRGNNLDSGNYLIHMPSDRIMGTLNFNFRAIKSQNWNPTEIQFISQYFFKQNRWNPNQEFLAPPSAYILFGGSISNEFKFFKNFHKISLTVDNIFNQSYRNYLNRQRFFADELGRNLVLKLDFRF
jgi:iron complex outermembrane receptor protein